MNKSLSLVAVLVGVLGGACARNSPAVSASAQESRNEARAQSSTPRSRVTEVAQNNQCNDWEVYFATGSAEISPDTRGVLDRLSQCIQAGNVRSVTVTGSADPRGGDNENLQLGARRADAIRAVLVEHGCDPNVVSTGTVGEATASGDPATYPVERRASIRTRDRAAY